MSGIRLARDTFSKLSDMQEKGAFPGDAYHHQVPSEPAPLLRGPFAREDGILVTLREPPYGGASVEFLSTGPHYRYEEIAYLGGGDYECGLNRIAEGYCRVPAEYIVPGSLRLFQEELELFEG